MDADGLPIVGPGIDLTKVPAINQKRTLAFLNHYVTHTVRFLNRFSCVCEEKLIALSTRIQRLETTLNILEAKLSSIPGLENVTVKTDTTTDPQTSVPQTAQATENPKQVTEKKDAAVEPVQEKKPTKTVSQDPRYAKYFKMAAVGVPEIAIKQKMAFEGLNPDLLNNPDAPVPEDSATPGGADDSDTDFSGDEQQAVSDSDSSSAFSD